MEVVKAAETNGLKKSIRFSETLSRSYLKMQLHPAYKWFIFILGLPVHLIVFFIYLSRRKGDTYSSLLREQENELAEAGLGEQLRQQYSDQISRKQAFFGQEQDKLKTDQLAAKWAEEQFQKIAVEATEKLLEQQGHKRLTYSTFFQSLIGNPLFLFITFLPGLPMYLLIFIHSNPYLKYIFERLVMSIFVIVGVAFFVFTILYISPFDPAANILGVTATKEQIAAFNQIYGLDQPYLTQLWNAMKGIFTFDLGAAYSGNEEVAASIARKFPITLTLTLIALTMAIVISIPIGIISATKPNSFFDYTFMFVALIGLSIPNFWQGLIFILNFSIKLQWLPATFNPQNWLSIIMPAVVLGTGLTASIARMTRSAILEVINEDYIITAKAKGLNKRQVLWKHAVGNAMIPVITVIGLMFGGMLGGAAVTEKVFNISGIGSYIVDKQFIPDIPSIMGGVVYIAITISLINLLIDILYAFFDPRIRSKMKQY
ncbi:ABC transporter permease [Bacillus sp. S/N-304-OC-R1]|uniref:ABC transporter permease n=1 Tax=Bacillus sp. S/N-304-OC-R1 TaxID=2758034 RepID=UPI001C8D4D54|nr:ABC transporter permease [Bacillus sp. S/N-304-OC-R1]MBY0123516.1 ABC transporter permease [Bacillus sp. S/N-304-OC-R1]